MQALEASCSLGMQMRADMEPLLLGYVIISVAVMQTLHTHACEQC